MASDAENGDASDFHSPDDSGDEKMANGNSKDRTRTEEDGDGVTEPRKYDPKDPSRPRRKKARRACFACQRAHLTCGDERPCQRCIKRGLQDACQDGVRKKAKYLHDAPNEALLPGASTHFRYQQQSNPQQQMPLQSPTYPISQSMADVYGSRSTADALPLYTQPSTTGRLSDTLMSNTAYSNQQSPIASQFQDPAVLQANLIQNMTTSAADASTLQDFTGNLFDTSDLGQYNFDPASFNFGNHYGALEFGMLGQMATGAAETPPSDHTASLGLADNMLSNAGGMAPVYVDSTVGPGYNFGQDQSLGEWRAPTQPQSNVRTRPTYNLNGMKQDQPNAFSIGTGSTFASPTTELSPAASKTIDDSPSRLLFGQTGTVSRPTTRHGQQQASSNQSLQQNIAAAFVPASRRRGDPSHVYRTVTQPYSYTTGFHSLTEFIQKRFSSQQTLRIAKALASIRPSFLACTKSLGREDLIFMEKCFQRSLWEYEDFIAATGTPTIVCRRTGEIAAVGKEFSILTGWTKDVLLGRESNLNTNRGNTATGTDVSTTPTRNQRLPEGVLETSNRPQPVFLAELLDDESVIQFYEDFARLAFGDSHGTITTRCKLLKYRAKDLNTPSTSKEEAPKSSSKRKRGSASNDAPGAARIDELGERDGKVDCCCCWTVKRDLFDLPMMIVMNFLPCI